MFTVHNSITGSLIGKGYPTKEKAESSACDLCRSRPSQTWDIKQDGTEVSWVFDGQVIPYLPEAE